jgi:hypothetical protein
MQTFTLSGHRYDAPSKIGHGARIMLATEWKRIYRAENPGMPTIGEDDNGTAVDFFTPWLQEHQTDYAIILAMLKVICQPTKGCPPVEEAFHTCEEHELEAVKSFFMQSGGDSTSTTSEPESLPPTSKTTAGRRKKS